MNTFEIVSDGTSLGTTIKIDGVEQKYIKRLMFTVDCDNILGEVTILRYVGLNKKLLVDNPTKTEFEKYKTTKGSKIEIKSE